MFANWNAGMEKSLYRNGRHADDAATVHESWKKILFSFISYTSNDMNFQVVVRWSSCLLRPRV